MKHHSSKRLLSLLLTIACIAALFPSIAVQSVSAKQTNTNALKPSIASQYDAFVKTLNASTPSECVSRFTNHSVNSTKDLSMGANDPFTAALLRSKLMRSSIIDGVSAALSAVSSSDHKVMSLRGTISWYEHKLEYGCSLYEENENGSNDDDRLLHTLHEADAYPYTDSINSYDEAMILLVGHAPVKYTLRQTAVTVDAITYRVSIYISDRFDFSGADYSSSNDTFTEVMRLLGAFLSMGLLHDFNWSAQTQFDVTIPNSCTHKSADSLWEYDGKQELVSSNAQGLTLNPLSRQHGTTENNVFHKTMYRTQTPIRLLHNCPWVLEIKCAGSGMLSLGSHSSLGGDAVYLRKAANTVFFGQSVRLNETDETNTLTHYGVWYTGASGISAADTHTYRLTNRIAADGSNMVYLSIDGADFGPMNHYYHSGTNMRETRDWVAGKDFLFNYISSLDEVSVDYIRVWENGIGNGAHFYTVTSKKSPSCTEQGYVRQHCTLCGANIQNETIPATGHSFADWTVVSEASCADLGSRTRSCGSCGHIEREDIPTLPHSNTVTTVYATCTQTGSTTETCTLCGSSNSTVIPALGHAYTETVTPPTCTADGYTTYVCTRCNDHYADTPTPAHGHSFGEWREHRPATGKTEGEAVRSCTTCGTEEAKPLPLLTHSFTDVPADAYFEEPVLWAVSKAITTGVTDTSFAPDSLCTRAQVITFLWRAAGKPMAEQQKCLFEDVAEDAYYRQAVLWAIDRGITSGVDTTHFAPEAPCSRAQVATLLWRSLGSPIYEGEGIGFEDVPSDHWAAAAVNWAARQNITAGIGDNRFAPDGICTRGQIVTFLYRAMK